MYAANMAILEAYRSGNKSNLADTTIFAALAWYGTDGEVRDFLWNVTDGDDTYPPRASLSATGYTEAFTILVSTGRNELAKMYADDILLPSEILVCVYTTYGVSAVTEWMRIDGVMNVNDSVERIVNYITMNETAEVVERDISAIVDECKSSEGYSYIYIDDVIGHAPVNVVKKIIDTSTAAMANAIVYLEDVSLLAYFFDVHPISTIGNDKISDVIDAILTSNFVAGMEWMLTNHRDVTIGYLATQTVWVSEDNEDVFLAVIDHLMYDHENAVRALTYGHMRLWKRIVADGRKYTYEKMFVTNPKGCREILKMLSASYPIHMTGVISRVAMSDKYKWALRDAKRDLTWVNCVTIKSAAELLAWRPPITLSGRWTVVGRNAYVDVDITTVCP